MRTRLATLALGLTLLAACKSAPLAPAKVTKSVTPEAIATSTSTSTSPASAGAVVKLQAPPGAVALSGKVEVDASYLVSQGGGNVIFNDGSSLVASGGGNLVDGQLQVGGRIVAQGTGNIVASGAGNVISHNGSAIVASGGGNVVASGGGNLVAQGGGNYHHLQAKDAPAYGTILPAAGLLVWVRDMQTGRPVSIGQDGQGQPIYAVYTNAEGKYEIYLEPELKNRVLVVTEVPYSKDPRLTYALVRDPEEKEARVTNEDSATLTRYLRETAAAKLQTSLILADRYTGGEVATPAQIDELIGLVFKNTNSSEAVVGILREPLGRVINAASQNKAIRALYEERKRFAKDSTEYQARTSHIAEVYREMAEYMGDLLVALAPDFRSLPINFNYAGKNDGPRLAASVDPNRPAMQHMEDVVRRLRERVTELGKGKSVAEVEQAFASKLYIQRANAFYNRLNPGNDGKPHYTIGKPADLASFLVREYFPLLSTGNYGCETGCIDLEATNPAPVLLECDLEALCIPEEGLGPLTNKQITALSTNVFLDLDLSADDYLLLVAGCSTLGESLALQLVADENVKTQIECLIRNYGNPELTCN